MSGGLLGEDRQSRQNNRIEHRKYAGGGGGDRKNIQILKFVWHFFFVLVVKPKSIVGDPG